MLGFWINRSACHLRIPRIGKRFRPERPQLAVDEAAQRPGVEGGVRGLRWAAQLEQAHRAKPNNVY